MVLELVAAELLNQLIDITLRESHDALIDLNRIHDARELIAAERAPGDSEELSEFFRCIYSVLHLGVGTSNFSNIDLNNHLN